MARQWTGSPTKQASMGSSSTASGKRECPYCHVSLVRIRSKQLVTKDDWFLVFPYNIKGDPTTCGFIYSELQFEALEAQQRGLQSGKEASGDCYAHLKQELDELKQIVDSVVADLWKLKQQLGAEAKVAVDTKKWHVVLDCSVVAPILVGLLGVLLGVLVVGLSK